MTERDVNERRNWKAQTFPYDYYLPDDSNECTYCLTDRQAELLRGLVEPLGWSTRWWRSGAGSIELDVIEAYRADLVRRLMMGCCGDEIPVRYRYTDEGVLESSEDGGTTWQPAPGDDIRITATQFPPVPGEPSTDKKCAAAAGMAALIKAQIGDQLTDDMSRYTLDQLIKDWTNTYIGTSNPFQAILTVAVNQIFALVISALRAALTDTVYHLLQCAFFCNIEDDLSFTAEGVQAAAANVGDTIGGIATLFLQQLIFLLGEAGLTNLARSYGAAEGDCSDCDCPGVCGSGWDIYPDVVPNKYGTIIERGDGYIVAEATVSVSGNYYIILQSAGGMSDCCYLTSHTDYPPTSPQTADGLLCGENFPVHGISDNQCIWLIQMSQNFPFVRKVTFSDCPP